MGSWLLASPSLSLCVDLSEELAGFGPAWSLMDQDLGSSFRASVGFQPATGVEASQSCGDPNLPALCKSETP